SGWRYGARWSTSRTRTPASCWAKGCGGSAADKESEFLKQKTVSRKKEHVLSGNSVTKRTSCVAGRSGCPIKAFGHDGSGYLRNTLLATGGLGAHMNGAGAAQTGFDGALYPAVG